jgi:hypothetical protein
MPDFTNEELQLIMQLLDKASVTGLQTQQQVLIVAGKIQKALMPKEESPNGKAKPELVEAK